MRILITNDDGIKAKGIGILEQIMRSMSSQGVEIFTYAPAQGVSGASRSMTFGNKKYVRVEKLGSNLFKVHGMPTNCVEISCRVHEPISLILSGINHSSHYSS